MVKITLTSDCPYCLTKNTFFEHLNTYRVFNNESYLTFLCRKCKNIVLCRISDNFFRNRDIDKSVVSLQLGETIDGWNVDNIFPNLPKIKVLDHLPEKISKYFLEAQEHLKNGHFETSIGVSRKVLEITTVQKLDEKQAVDKQGKILSKEDLIKRPLRRRVDLLFENNLITQDMHDWATLIREEGNNAVHSDEDYTQEEAQELIDFTEVFLMYLYTLPQMVIEKRKP